MNTWEDSGGADGQAADNTSSDATTVALRIYGVEFQIRCAEADVEDLNAVAADLDKRMRHIHKTSNVSATERLAVMAALNLGHEHRRQSRRTEYTSQELARLVERLDDALERHQADSSPAADDV